MTDSIPDDVGADVDGDADAADVDGDADAADGDVGTTAATESAAESNAESAAESNAESAAGTSTAMSENDRLIPPRPPIEPEAPVPENALFVLLGVLGTIALLATAVFPGVI